MALTPPPAFAAEGAGGFDFCAPPLRPACVEATDAGPQCDDEVRAFIGTVFKYRACLEKETERAVREANETLNAWKRRRTGVGRR